jgi:predicted glycoside hydrolase/deacetylase ChbG (UPF0249 family)
VNRGIIETIERGVVTSASLMVNTPGCADAIRRLASLDTRGARPSIGLHFNIVAGRPLAPCDTLVATRDGEFLSLGTLAVKAFARRIDEHDVERELDAQLDKARDVLAGLGARLTHIDSHRHAHCLPVVFDVVTRTAHRLGVSHVRRPYESGTVGRRPHAWLASRLLRVLLARRAPYDGVGFTGFGAMASHTFEADILALLQTLPSGTTELMVHPGYDSPELAAIDPYRAPREREVRALTSPAVRARVRELGVELVPFDATTPPA